MAKRSNDSGLRRFAALLRTSLGFSTKKPTVESPASENTATNTDSSAETETSKDSPKSFEGFEYGGKTISQSDLEAKGRWEEFLELARRAAEDEENQEDQTPWWARPPVLRHPAIQEMLEAMFPSPPVSPFSDGTLRHGDLTGWEPHPDRVTPPPYVAPPSPPKAGGPPTIGGMR